MDSVSITCGFYGASGVGKSTFILRHKTGEFNTTSYLSKIDTVLPFYTSRGLINVRCVEDCNPINIDCAIVLFDDRNTPHHATGIIEMLKCTGLTNIILCWSKSDMIRVKDNNYNRITDMISRYGIVFYDISAKSNYNFGKPFLHCMRKRTNDNTLHFKESTEVLA